MLVVITVVVFLIAIAIAGQVIGQTVSQGRLEHHQLSLRVQRRGCVPAAKAVVVSFWGGLFEVQELDEDVFQAQHAAPGDSCAILLSVYLFLSLC